MTPYWSPYREEYIAYYRQVGKIPMKASVSCLGRTMICESTEDSGVKQQNGREGQTRWWFQRFFIFTPIYLGKIPILTHIFQMG